MKKRIESDLLYSAALKLFSRYGYKKATLEDIAAELEMTNASIYAYVESKRELYEQTVRFVMLKWQNSVKNSVEKESTAFGKLKTMCKSALYYLSEDKEFCLLLANDPNIFPMFPVVDNYEDINEKSVLLIIEILELGVRTGEFRAMDIKTIAELVFAIYKSFIIHAYINGESEFIDKNLPESFDLLLRGIENK